LHIPLPFFFLPSPFLLIFVIDPGSLSSLDLNKLSEFEWKSGVFYCGVVSPKNSYALGSASFLFFPSEKEKAKSLRLGSWLLVIIGKGWISCFTLEV
jgi:hypothetical protein